MRQSVDDFVLGSSLDRLPIRDMTLERDARERGEKDGRVRVGLSQFAPLGLKKTGDPLVLKRA